MYLYSIVLSVCTFHRFAFHFSEYLTGNAFVFFCFVFIIDTFIYINVYSPIDELLLESQVTSTDVLLFFVFLFICFFLIQFDAHFKCDRPPARLRCSWYDARTCVCVCVCVCRRATPTSGIDFTDTMRLHKQIQVCDHSSLIIRVLRPMRETWRDFVPQRWNMPHAHRNAALQFLRRPWKVFC